MDIFLHYEEKKSKHARRKIKTPREKCNAPTVFLNFLHHIFTFFPRCFGLFALYFCQLFPTKNSNYLNINDLRKSLINSPYAPTV